MATLTWKTDLGGRKLENGRGWFERAMIGWRHVIQVSEATLVDNVAATVPWLAPVAPAYMAWHNAVMLLGWPVWVAWVVAAAVEGLGLSVIATAFQLWRGARRGAFWVAVCTVGFYLGVVITVNVLLELGWPAWVAKALLSLLSVPAAVTIALRTQAAQAAQGQAEADEREYQRDAEADERIYRRQVEAEERARAFELKKMKAERKVSGNFPEKAESSRQPSGAVYRSWHDVPESEWGWIAAAASGEIVRRYGLSGADPERTARNWRNYAKEELSNE